MINKFIRRVMMQPGRYAITSFVMLLRGAYYCVEVDEQGLVWQLDPQGERDGELRLDGWKGDEIVIDPRSLDDATLRRH